MNNIKFIIGVAFILLCTRISAQSLIWQKTYGSDSWNAAARSVIETTDGGYMIGGGGYDPIAFYFIKTDNKGDTLWTKQYFTDLNGYSCLFVTQVPDGGYISIGIGGDLCKQLQILKLDIHGDSLWHKSLDCYEDAYPTSTKDGGYLVTGQKLTDIGYRAYLLKLDSLGNKQWENTYGGPEFTNGHNIILTKDGNYMLVGRNTVKNIPMWGYDYGVYMAKVKPNGDSIWTKTFNGKGNTYGTSIIEGASGDFIIGGYTDSISNKGAYIIKTDKDGNLKWEKTYGKTKYDSWGWGTILPTINGGYILTGSRGAIDSWPPDNRAGDIYLAKIDSDGTIMWDKYYGGDWQDLGGILKKTNDGGYILLGSTLSFSTVKYQRIYLAKLDSAFNVFGVGINNKQVNNTDNSTSGFKVFPNPTTSGFTIEHTATKKEALTIYNILGDLVYKDNWLQGQTQKSIDMVALPKGIYIIRLGDAVQKVVKE